MNLNTPYLFNSSVVHGGLPGAFRFAYSHSGTTHQQWCAAPHAAAADTLVDGGGTHTAQAFLIPFFFTCVFRRSPDPELLAQVCPSAETESKNTQVVNTQHISVCLLVQLPRWLQAWRASKFALPLPVVSRPLHSSLTNTSMPRYAESDYCFWSSAPAVHAYRSRMASQPAASPTMLKNSWVISCMCLFQRSVTASAKATLSLCWSLSKRPLRCTPLFQALCWR